MKKRVWLVLLAVVLVLGLGMLGCSSSSDGDGDGDGDGGKEMTLDKVKIDKNEWSEDKDNSKGNQAKVPLTSLGKPKKGDKYTLTFKATSDVTVAKDSKGTAMALSIVDSSEAAGWWTEIGEWSDVTGATIGTDKKSYANIATVTQKAEFEFTGTYTVTGDIKGVAKDIILAFGCEGQPWATPVNLTFSSFSLKKN